MPDSVRGIFGGRDDVAGYVRGREFHPEGLVPGHPIEVDRIAAAAGLFSREGVAPMHGPRSDDRFVEIAENLRRDGTEVEHCVCDIGSPADTAALVDKTLARLGRLDGSFFASSGRSSSSAGMARG